MLRKILQKAKAYITLIRPIGWMPFFFALTFGLIDSGFESIKYVFLVHLIYGPLLLGGIYTLNFYSDIEVDKKSNVVKDVVMAEQPFASGKVGKTEGLVFSICLLVLGLFLSLLVNLSLFLFSITLVSIGIIYSFGPRLKSVPFGDIIVNSFSSVLVYSAGWSTFKKITNVNPYPLIWMFFLIAATYLLTVLVDIEGDRKTNQKTTAVILGTENAYKLSFAFYFTSMIFYVLTLLHMPNLAYIIFAPFLLAKAPHSYLKRIKNIELRNIYELGKTATKYATGGVIFLWILYTALRLAGLKEIPIIVSTWGLLK